jgi:signal transduction histidine kinase
MKRHTAEVGSISSKNVLESADHALTNQRKSEDKAIENERSNMDTALRYERSEKERLMKKVFSQEREATDKNLMGERVKTDLHVERSAELLTLERAAHVEAKSALTTREEFVAIVSHDLRNPIGAILSSAEILLEEASIVGISSDAKSLIELIKRNAETSLQLISDILDMERIVEGKIQLQLTKNRIDDLIIESAEGFAHAASAKKILLKTVLLNNSNTVMCDKDRVAQILSNLIGNALKFTPTGGSVTIEAHETKNEVTISVRDTGPGIPDDQKSRIFERYAQIGNKQRGGLGLGLYISKTLVESHLGKLWVASVPGAGSTFWFTLPIRAQ